jgi:hypothetical protein
MQMERKHVMMNECGNQSVDLIDKDFEVEDENLVLK